MYRLPLRFVLVTTIAIASSCSDTGDDPGMDTSIDAGMADAAALVPGPWPAGCVVTEDDYLPRTLECTGLYVGALANKQLASDVREYAPAVALWSDGADKRRWISLPPGTTIDNSNPVEWSFPVGTRVWKEFRKNGQRVETRLFYKTGVDEWKRATYAWRDNETQAEIWQDQTGVANVLKLNDGSDYVLPTRTECNDCHKGRKDKLLGFEQILLGLPGASGFTLADLASEGRLASPPARTRYTLPDDGTGVGASALSYLHVNCGISCHNESSLATGYPSGMFLRIDPTRIDLPVSEWNSVKTTLNVTAHIANFYGETRIVPGAPEKSLVIDVASTRGSNRQMPPIATRMVDARGVALLKEWVIKLGGDAGAPNGDAGMPALDAGTMQPGGLDGGIDAGMDAGTPGDPGPVI